MTVIRYNDDLYSILQCCEKRFLDDDDDDDDNNNNNNNFIKLMQSNYSLQILQRIKPILFSVLNVLKQFL